MKYKSILFAKQKQRHRSREQTYGYQGSKGKSAELGDWNWHIYTIDAAAAAKSLQSCLTLCNPTDGSPPGSTVPGITTYKIDNQWEPTV